MSSLPEFTVIVPTRNRADTLRHALRTCTEQDYERLTIVVSNNASDDDTADLLAGIRDPRIRALNTGTRLGMSQNWEFALGHVQDGFVLYLGDDDGLLPRAIGEMASLLVDSNCDAMGWREAKYHWPDCGGVTHDNLLRVPLGTRKVVRGSREALQRVVNFAEPYTALPSLYWGVAHMRVLRRASNKAGRFFSSLNPDVYSAIAIAMSTDRFVWSERAYRLNGHSRHSTGASFSAATTSESSPRSQFLREANLEFHRDYVLVPSKPIYVAESYQQARENVPGGDAYPPISWDMLLDTVMRIASDDLEPVYTLIRAAVIEMGDRNEQRQLAEKVIERHPYRSASRPGVLTANTRFSSIKHPTLKLHGDDFDVRDIYGAARLCYTIVRLVEGGYLSPSAALRRVASAIRTRALSFYSARSRRDRP